ncbi:MAG: hypothetical protein JRD03_10150 [Deltaproteobacteria bacterium]|nr:hypothetical protein [Deltaproteobacteria bacterium]
MPARGADKFKKLDESERQASIFNQFQPGGRDVELRKTQQFCTPVYVGNGDVEILDPSTNLTCYSSRPRPTDQFQVMTTDEFGNRELNVKKQRTQLCVASQLIGNATPTPTAVPTFLPVSPSTALQRSVSLDDFEVYKATRTPGTPKSDRIQVRVRDDNWEDEDNGYDEFMTVKKTVELGVPSNENGEGSIMYPTAHLTCYAIIPPRFRQTDIEVSNRTGQWELRLRRPHRLCMPATKTLLGET